MALQDHRHAWTRAHLEHDPLGDVEASGQIDRFKAADDKLCRDIWAVLQHHYPGHPWHVAASSKQGMVQIFLPTFSTWSYNIRMADMTADPGFRLVIKGAGEMLERYQLPRAGFSISQYVAAQLKFRPMFNINKPAPG